MIIIIIKKLSLSFSGNPLQQRQGDHIIRGSLSPLQQRQGDHTIRDGLASLRV